MTTSKDEIDSLRSHLEHIRQWCDHEIKNGYAATERGIFSTVSDMARRALKTPRATEIYVRREGLPPASQP